MGWKAFTILSNKGIQTYIISFPYETKTYEIFYENKHVPDPTQSKIIYFNKIKQFKN